MAIHILVTDKTLEGEIEEMCKFYAAPKFIKFQESIPQTPELKRLTYTDILVVYGVSHFKTIYGMFSLLHFATSNKIRLVQFKDKKDIPGNMSVREFLEFFKAEEEAMRNLWKRGFVKKPREPRAKYLTYEGVKRVSCFMKEGLTQQEMATRMGCSLGTIKLAVGRVRKEKIERKEEREAANEKLRKRFVDAMKIAYRKEFL